MLSYRHAFHAGNAADVFKHSVLFSFLMLYTKKEKPFTAFDLNGGAGIYNLLSDWSLQTNEAETGIIRLLKLYRENKLPRSAPEDFKSYLEFCGKNYQADYSYAGSPEIMRSFLTPGAQLIITDLHTAEADALKQRYKNSTNVHIHKRDCYEALYALTPPSPVRGFVLFDPSYEVASDYSNITQAIEKARSRWAAGIFIVWYPLLDRRKSETETLKQTICSLKNTESFTVEVKHGLYKGKPAALQTDGYGLSGSGLIAVNPPYGLQKRATAIAEYLADIYA